MYQAILMEKTKEHDRAILELADKVIEFQRQIIKMQTTELAFIKGNTEAIKCLADAIQRVAEKVAEIEGSKNV